MVACMIWFIMIWFIMIWFIMIWPDEACLHMTALAGGCKLLPASVHVHTTDSESQE